MSFTYRDRSTSGGGFITDVINAFETLGTYNINLGEFQVIQVIKGMPNTKLALQFFGWMAYKQGFKHSKKTFNTMLKRLGTSNLFREMESLFEEMKRGECQPDDIVYTTMIRVYLDAFRLDKATDKYMEMVADGRTPDKETYRSLIMVNKRKECYKTALAMGEAMKIQGKHGYDEHIFTMLIDCAGKCGNIEKAERLYDEMQQQGIPIPFYVFGSLIHMNGREGKIEKAKGFWEDVERAGMTPNTHMYTSMVGAFIKLDQLEEAKNLLRQMVTNGVEPNSFTITGHKDATDILSLTGHSIYHLLQNMSELNLKHNMALFLKSLALEPTDEGLRRMVDYVYKKGQKQEAAIIWDEAVKEGIYKVVDVNKQHLAWTINLHNIADGTAQVALSRSLAEAGTERFLNKITIVTGWGKHSEVKGASIVKEGVEKLLKDANFPFGDGGEGSFVSSGLALRGWLRTTAQDGTRLMVNQLHLQ